MIGDDRFEEIVTETKPEDATHWTCGEGMGRFSVDCVSDLADRRATGTFSAVTALQGRVKRSIAFACGAPKAASMQR